jgi:hypothetical protein
VLSPSDDDDYQLQPPTKRIRKENSLFAHYILTTTSGQGQSGPTAGMKPMYFESIDQVLQELSSRFNHTNSLYSVGHALCRSSPDFLDRSTFVPLQQLGLPLPSAEEMVVGKKCLMRNSNGDSESDILKAAYDHRLALPDLYTLIATMATFGCSTAACECSFSTLSRIDVPQRRSMESARLRSLVLLAFESKRTTSLEMDSILRRFSEKKNRRLQLF